jgi:hypothetical protein
MSILIIGDSYAAQGRINELDAEYSYQNILRNHYNLNVDNYGFAGHSLFKIYRQLINCATNFRKYNLIVVLITSFGRVYIPNCNIGIGSIGNAENLITRYEDNDIPEDYGYPTLEQIKAARDYYKHLKDANFENYVHYSLVESIKSLLSKYNYVLLPVKSDSIKKQGKEWSLMDMTFKQLENFSNTPLDFQMDRYSEIHGRILNHLTIENNQVLADFIYRRYNDNSVQFDNSVFKPATVNDFFYYYKANDN